MTLFYCDHYEFPLPAGHKFPLSKYRLLRERLAKDPRILLQPSRFASREELLGIHEPEYVDGFLNGTLDPGMMRRIGFPWSPELVQRTLASVGATLLATEAALETGFGGTLAGGTHHAFRAEGAGFCVFNDLAVAAGWALAERRIARIAILDLDVHQGDGTAAIFGGDVRVFTISVHGARNFPFRKQSSGLDIELPDGTEDDGYLAVLERALARLGAFRPQLLLFQAGVDSLATDRLGRLALTPRGLAQRDSLVIENAYHCGIPIVVTVGGGYSADISHTVAAHAQTFQIAAEIYAGKHTVEPAPF
jgi:acetoin utilization deacetylase AcuC-like enzyme